MICLLLGVAIGYLLRGSAPATAGAPQAAAQAPTAVPGSAMAPGTIPGFGGMPGVGQAPEMVDKAAVPLLETLKANPKDVATLAKLGNLYYDAQQYPKAIEYYDRVLKIEPSDSDVRTDMGTAYFYAGDPDRAIKEFEKSLSYRPNHGGTLFNMGVVKWQGKSDAVGAVQAWEKLLQVAPDYPDKQRVLDLISRAKQHAKG